MNNGENLTADVARRIIDRVGGSGQPPEYGFQYFTAGLEPYLSVVDSEYLHSFIRQGGSTFKMVVGVYGGGKTHFLYCVRDLAWRHNFVVSYVSLSPEESPFHRLDLVYRAVVNNIVPPLSSEELLSGYEKGIEAFIKRWYSQKSQELREQGYRGEILHTELSLYLDQISGIESTSFSNAVKAAFRALMSQHEQDKQDFDYICQWIKGEGYDRRNHGAKYRILEKIDKTTAFRMMRSLAQWVREIGYSGLVVLLDEAERVPSLSTKQRELLLSNLREIIDECGHTSFQGVMIFYAVPDERFLEGRTQIYEALRQRVDTTFSDAINPTGVKIELEKIVTEPIAFLREVGEKLIRVYEVAYNHKFEASVQQKLVELVAEYAYEQRFGDIGYKRLFVQKLVQAMHYLRRQGVPPSKEDLSQW